MIRAQSEDAAAPSLRIPTPEELGIGSKKVISGDEPLDWAMVDRRLDQVGATGYQMDKTATGFRFTCHLPAGPVTGRGPTKNEAVRSALAQLAK